MGRQDRRRDATVKPKHTLLALLALPVLAFAGYKIWNHYVLPPQLDKKFDEIAEAMAEVDKSLPLKPGLDKDLEDDGQTEPEDPAPDPKTTPEAQPEEIPDVQSDVQALAMRKVKDIPGYLEMVARERAKMQANMQIGSENDLAFKAYVVDICTRQFEHLGDRSEMSAIHCYNSVNIGNENNRWQVPRSHSPDTGIHIFSRNSMVKDDSVYTVRMSLDCYQTKPRVGWIFHTLTNENMRFIDEPKDTLINVGLVFDDGTRSVLTTRVSANGLAIWIADERRIISFMQELENKSLLQVIFPGVYYGPRSAVFDLNGYDQYIPTLREACGW